MNPPPTPAQLAKGALRRLALSQQEPTPENYARAWAEELGQPAAAAPLPERARAPLERLVARASDDAALRAELVRLLMHGQWDELARSLDRGADHAAAAAQAWAALVGRIVRGLERGGRQWTTARKKDSLQRVLDGSRGDVQRLQQRLGQLLAGWESDTPLADEPAMAEGGAETIAEAVAEAQAPAADAPPAPPPAARDDGHWPAVTGSLSVAVATALPASVPSAAELAAVLSGLADRIRDEGATGELVAAVQAACTRAQRLFVHRHHLVEQLGALCLELTAGLTELAEQGSWAQGQADAMRQRLRGSDDAAEAFTVRGVRAAGELLAQTRAQQQLLRTERDAARDALKTLVRSLLEQVGELGDETGRFSDNLGRYADSIAGADSIGDLTAVVQAMVDESRAVQQRVRQSQHRLGEEHARATELEGRVRDLESELRRLSDEVQTDALTQVANRRGLMAAFDTERARIERDGRPLAVGLIDIDNFKKLNDTLGHAAGDEALKSLARRVRDTLRPVDHVARFGGEEFVVLLPDTPVDEAQQVLTRLQRSLSASLFMHDGQDVFVTFSAGVTAYRPGERIELALERADAALYDAKHQGKNRTCIG